MRKHDQAERKDQRIYLRVNARQQTLIRHAAELRDRSVTDFILDSATQRAEEVLAHQNIISVSDETYDWLVEQLEQPPRLLPELAKFLIDPEAFGYPDAFEAP